MGPAGVHWGHAGVQLGSRRGPLACHWGPTGVALVSTGVPLGSPGAHWGTTWVHWGPTGVHWVLCLLRFYSIHQLLRFYYPENIRKYPVALGPAGVTQTLLKPMK